MNMMKNMIRATLLSTLLASSHGFAQCVKVKPKTFAFTFTGYKFTEKVGVSGSFDKMNFTIKDQGELADVLKSSALEIETDSINAGAKARDVNIRASLFKTLVGGKKIKATGSKLDSAKKQLWVDLEMGGKTQQVPLDYTVSEMGKVELTGTADLLKLGFNDAFNALAKKCKALHKGKDGASKTWSDVALKFSVDTESC